MADFQASKALFLSRPYLWTLIMFGSAGALKKEKETFKVQKGLTSLEKLIKSGVANSEVEASSSYRAACQSRCLPHS